MASLSMEGFVGNGALKEVLPKLLEEGWDDVPTLKVMNSDDMDAIHMTQLQKDALATRSYLHDCSLMQYGDVLEASGKSLAELLKLSTYELSAKFGMKRGHIVRFMNKKGTSSACAAIDPLLEAPHALPSSTKTTTPSRYNCINHVTMDVNLYEAVMEGKVDVLRQHVNQIDNQVTPNNNTVLHVAAQFGQLQCVEEILKECPVLLRRVNNKCETPLHFAVREERLDVAKALIDCAKELDRELESGGGAAKEILRATNEDKDTALHMAVRNEHLDLVKLLTGEDPEFQHPANNTHETPLYLATEIGCDDVVSAILRTCTSPAYGGPGGRTALHAAAIINNWFSTLINVQKKNQIMRRLLEWNQDLIKEADEYGWTPLHYAARCRNVEGVRQLLKVDKSAAYITTLDKDDEKTALHIAAAGGYKSEMEEILLQCPDCWEMVNGKGQNILHVAMDMGEKDAIEFIKDNPWSSHLKKQKDIEGNTPLHLLYLYDDVTLASAHLISTNEWCNREYKWAFNDKNITPEDILWSKSQDFHLVCGGRNIVSRDQELITKRRAHKEENRKNQEENRKNQEERDKAEIEAVMKISQTHLIVATLIATISFAAGFTMPGGYNSNKGSKQGMPLLITEASFKLFVIANTIAAICSTSSVFLYVTAALHNLDRDDDNKLMNLMTRYAMALFLILIAVAALIVAFITGSYAVLSHSLGIAIATCVGTCSFIILIPEVIKLCKYKFITNPDYAQRLERERIRNQDGKGKGLEIKVSMWNRGIKLFCGGL